MSKIKRKDPNLVDAVGQYRKHVREGIELCNMAVTDVPVPLRVRFRAALELNNDSANRAFHRFMIEYVKAVENKYNVCLTPEKQEEQD